ncbi:hypothetical protein SNEBB_009278 [Seison nebaliae]|nr:hypothetical protein SNEBB_009278 [Seison nebaliae]
MNESKLINSLEDLLETPSRSVQRISETADGTSLSTELESNHDSQQSPAPPPQSQQQQITSWSFNGEEFNATFKNDNILSNMPANNGKVNMNSALSATIISSSSTTSEITSNVNGLPSSSSSSSSTTSSSASSTTVVPISTNITTNVIMNNFDKDITSISHLNHVTTNLSNCSNLNQNNLLFTYDENTYGHDPTYYTDAYWENNMSPSIDHTYQLSTTSKTSMNLNDDNSIIEKEKLNKYQVDNIRMQVLKGDYETLKRLLLPMTRYSSEAKSAATRSAVEAIRSITSNHSAGCDDNQFPSLKANSAQSLPDETTMMGTMNNQLPSLVPYVGTEGNESLKSLSRGFSESHARNRFETMHIIPSSSMYRTQQSTQHINNYSLHSGVTPHNSHDAYGYSVPTPAGLYINDYEGAGRNSDIYFSQQPQCTMNDISSYAVANDYEMRRANEQQSIIPRSMYYQQSYGANDTDDPNNMMIYDPIITGTRDLTIAHTSSIQHEKENIEQNKWRKNMDIAESRKKGIFC